MVKIFIACKKLVEKDINDYGHITDELRLKIDTLYLGNRLTQAEYDELIAMDPVNAVPETDIPADATPDTTTDGGTV